ncbi:MAG: hypothetical protein QNJ70_03515 [Xenococcaceae cyanobacterium MO_207.B15]|nr:hypothetical protein [Xenococcaceae cyanobacterium MO_207.B15]MDJ0745144.1 hypothetical protein [Xenococcaceae cyanobacterium MO_167.B27]
MKLVIVDQYGSQIDIVVSCVNQLATGKLEHSVVTTNGKTLYQQSFPSTTSIDVLLGLSSALASAKKIYKNPNLGLIFYG